MLADHHAVVTFQMAQQALFNQVYRGLQAQGFERARDSMGLCAYRANEGRKCAAGHLINDDEYTPELEGCSLRAGVLTGRTSNQNLLAYALLKSGVPIPLLQTVTELQEIHDLNPLPENMKAALVVYAEQHGLVVPS